MTFACFWTLFVDYPSLNTLHLDPLPSCLGAVHDTLILLYQSVSRPFKKDHQIHLMDVHPSILTFIPCEHYWQNPVAVCPSGDAGNRWTVTLKPSESISLWLHCMIDYLCVWLTHEATRHSLASHSLLFLPPNVTVHTPCRVCVLWRGSGASLYQAVFQPVIDDA